MPEGCIRVSYCFKRTLKMGLDGNDFTTVSRETEALIERSADELIIPYVIL